MAQPPAAPAGRKAGNLEDAVSRNAALGGDHFELEQAKVRLRKRTLDIEEMEADLKSSEQRLASAQAQIALVRSKQAEVQVDLAAFFVSQNMNRQTRITRQDEDLLREEFSKELYTLMRDVQGWQSGDEAALTAREANSEEGARRAPTGDASDDGDGSDDPEDPFASDERGAAVEVTWMPTRKDDRLHGPDEEEEEGITSTCARRLSRPAPSLLLGRAASPRRLPSRLPSSSRLPPSREPLASRASAPRARAQSACTRCTPSST